MITLFLIGLAVLPTDGSRHRVEFRMDKFASVEECQQASGQIAQAVSENLGKSIAITSKQCR